MIIYRILENGYYGGALEVDDNTQGIPLGTTRTPVPEIPENQYAIWRGTAWALTTQPPPMILPEPDASSTQDYGDTDLMNQLEQTY
jgi:hypothetical protein